MGAAMLGIGRRSGGAAAQVIMLAINESGADGTTDFIDESPQANVLTAEANAVWSDINPPTGQTTSLLLDGADSRVVSDTNVLFDLGAQDWTFEGFILHNAPLGSKECFGLRTSPNFSPVSIIQQSNNISFFASSDGANWNVADTSLIGVLAPATWAHVAVTREGSTFRKFMDGVKDATDVSFAGALYNAAEGMNIGGVTSAFWNGNVCSVRFTLGAALYTEDFTPPALPLTP